MNIASKHHTLGLISTFVLGTLLIIAIPATIIANSPKPQEVTAVTVITAKSSDQYISNYYSTISTSQSGLPLASSLESRLQAERNNSFSYGSLQTTAFPYTDVDPLRPTGGYIVSFYSGTPVYGYTGMNKEHTWPNSHGGGYIENDPHMVRPTLTSENSARGNSYYAESPSDGWDPASFNNEKYRGIAARIIFYGAVIGYTEGLRLEDVGFVSGTGNGGEMGKLLAMSQAKSRRLPGLNIFYHQPIRFVSLMVQRMLMICKVAGRYSLASTDTWSMTPKTPLSITVQAMRQ